MPSETRRDFLRRFASAGLAVATGCATSPRAGRRAGRAGPRPNILLIIDDQHSPRAMGWTGQTQVRTPHLDRFAAESVRFVNGYCSSPVCAPTRHTIYSGLYPSEHGVLHNDRPMRDVPTIAALLNHAGYTTASIGKMHNAPYHHRRDFQYVLHHEFYDSPAGISHCAPFQRAGLAERGIEPRNWARPLPGRKTWLDAVETIAFAADWMPEDLTAERWTTDESIRFIREHVTARPDRPFFLHASYFPPHHPYGPIPRYAGLYDPADMELPPSFDREKLAAWWRRPKDPMTDADVRWLRAHYFGFCTQLDAEAGRLLDGLEELGVSGNTLAIFVSDHGDMLGEHGRFYKGVMYEGSARVPFMVRWPGVAEPRTERALVSHADIAPTILQAAGLDVPANLPGRNLAPLLEDRSQWREESVYAEYFSMPASHLMLRRGPFKLMGTASYGDWSELQFQLFNVDDDPWELDDLYRDSGHREIAADLHRDLMRTWGRQRTHLPDRIPPPMPRSRYDIAWPADPWRPVRPVGPL